MHIGKLKQKLRQLKKLEEKIRFGHEDEASKRYVWMNTFLQNQLIMS